MKILNTTKATMIAECAIVANTFLSRIIGLLNRKSLEAGEALMITHCRSIHMFFMRFPIDAIFINKENRVVGLLFGIKPFRLSPVFWQASFVIELPIGSIERSKTSVGDTLEIKE